MAVKVFTSPEPIQRSMNYSARLFLAGSIEMGKAEDWQQKVITLLNSGVYGKSRFAAWRDANNLAVYNPRRKEWDSTWEQSITNPAFYQQVDWELRALEASTHVLMYLAPNTISPISLMEVGLYANSGKLEIVCDPAFHRRGNIEVISEHYNIPLYNKLEEYIYKLNK